jgi:hypothetical protein
MNQPLSPAANAAWEAFNEVAERVGVFEDYGDALAAALRALAEQMPNSYPACLEQMPEDARRWYRLGFGAAGNCDRSWLSEIAAELES